MALLLLLSACSEGDGVACNVEEQNQIVHEAMLDRYYWYDQVPTTLNYASFSSPSQTLAYLRYASLDRFSYITSQAAFDNLFNNGTYVGYGFSYVVENNNSAWIRFVYNQSSAGAERLERGDEILSINGQSVINIIAADSWDRILSAGGIGTDLTLELRRKSSGLVENMVLTRNTVTINTVLHSDVFTSGGNKIGYLVFNSFLNTSLAELAPVFAQFKLDGVNQLVLDLRYNGGGSISVARELASYIKNTTSANSDLYVELRYNDKYQSDNFSYYFRPQAGSLALTELTVITSEATCSASEQVISALQPYFTRVTTIGGSSCGKPVGMNPMDFCDNKLVAVNFASFNADGQGNYYGGIPASCVAADDVDFALGDPAEPMLATALHYLDNLNCPVAPRLLPQPPPGGLIGLQAIAGAV